MPQPICIGCDARLKLGTLATQIIPPNGRRPGAVCPSCSQRAEIDGQYRRVLERCAETGVRFAKLSRLFASIGVFEVPTSIEDIAEAVGMPAAELRRLVSGGVQ